ncbi:hypothetical protein [Methylobacterium sp. R2-1]|uniref:hypothetical protein n=1 Tax=Methylobacterium sp. R2-1 TaxID=2587064 RepID=UPI0016157C8B|nr:hypothetical protein [Methylobacterium sp. R2-1]MBB2962534.1 hypothetical protein [Methylobacterium sp. R2-1]
MENRTSVQLSIFLAAAGLVFWVVYVLKFILGDSLFLAGADDTKIGVQIAFGVYGYLTLLVGVFVGAVYQEIKSQKGAGNVEIAIGPSIGRALRGADFWLGIFASPVVYAVLLQAVNLETITASGFVGLTLVGLQNGFVCNTIAETIIGGKPKPLGVGGTS